jgi:hypothetical protein
MNYRLQWIVPLILACLLVPCVEPQQFRAEIPKVWVDADISSLEVPLATPSATPRHLSASTYYRLPVRTIYRSYPIYAPGREPQGYFHSLETRDPEIVFNPARLDTEQDWVRAGELVFDTPLNYDGQVSPADVQDPAWWKKMQLRALPDGTLPYLRYFVRQKGKVEVGNLSCASCHTRVLADGTVIEGAQGDFPFDRVFANSLLRSPQPIPPTVFRFYGVPWLKTDLGGQIAEMSAGRIIAALEATPAGVQSRHGTSFIYPVQVPDLIGVQERRYLDHTGLQLHRGIVDLMRYAAMNQDAVMLAHYGDFCPRCGEDGNPPPRSGRYSDEQLYALALYVYSLQPPRNPNRFDEVAARGEKVFISQGCGQCHTPPLYTNNKLTPAAGFVVPDEYKKRFDILSVVVGTDSGLTLKTRRGTGFYKVPSLKGVWYRGPFEHDGSVATLEDWFDPKRLSEVYVPTGFKGFEMAHRPIKGHEFGTSLSPTDKAALIAFLRTL